VEKHVRAATLRVEEKIIGPVDFPEKEEQVESLVLMEEENWTRSAHEERLEVEGLGLDGKIQAHV
jgi:hypothetical protein